MCVSCFQAVDRTTAVETIEIIICQQKREDTIACRASLHACLTSRHGMQQQDTSFEEAYHD